jgi:hypothetical protein
MENPMKWLQRLRTELRSGENLDMYLAVAGAIILGGLNLTGVIDSNHISGAILALLGLLAIGHLTTRARLENLRDAMSHVNTSQYLLSFPPSYAEDLKAVGDIWLFGVTRRATINDFYHQLGERLRAGKRVRVLLVAPGSPAAQLAARRIRRSFNIDRSIGESIDLIKELHSEGPDFLELRLTEQELGFGITFVNPSDPTARLYVEYYSYRTLEDSHLRLILTAHDRAWFDLHRKQLELLWDDARPVTLDGSSSSQ